MVEASMVVYRIVGSDPPTVDDFKSNHELGKPIRPRSPEAAYRMVWYAVSVFERFEQAEALAQRFPKLGDFVATARLEPDQGFSYALWGSRGHMSVWGDPAGFLGAVADTVAISTVDTDAVDPAP